MHWKEVVVNCSPPISSIVLDRSKPNQKQAIVGQCVAQVRNETAIRCQSVTDVRIGQLSTFSDGQGMGDYDDSILDLEQMICSLCHLSGRAPSPSKCDSVSAPRSGEGCFESVIICLARREQTNAAQVSWSVPV
jgi:hypothetical protein